MTTNGIDTYNVRIRAPNTSEENSIVDGKPVSYSTLGK